MASDRPPPAPTGRFPAVGVAALVALAVLVAACSDSSGDGAAPDSGDGYPGSSPASTTPAGDPVAGDGSDSTGSGGDDTAATGAWYEQGLVVSTVATLDQPTALAARPGGDHLWILERVGRVRLVERTVDEAAGTETFDLVDEPVLDLTGQVGTEGEGGLLGLAFSPDGSELYLHYTDTAGDTVVSAFPLDGDRVGEGGERVVLTVDQPYSNHNGGDLRTGPDGLLYVALGDGGSGGDPDGNGQDTSTLLGSILRIDPTPPSGGYDVPADNPFPVGGDARPEIWLYGVRNPWRFSFDPATGDLWIGDVGQDQVEEIDLLPAADGGGRGANLGWNLVEGDRSFSGDAPEGHVSPVHVYSHDDDGGCSVTGGEVYRGALVPALDGVYLFSDLCAGGVVGLQPVDGAEPVVAPLVLDRAPVAVISFGRGPDGEVYLLEQGGTVSRIEPQDPPLATVVTGG